MKLFCARHRNAVRTGLVLGEEAALLPERFDDLVAIIDPALIDLNEAQVSPAWLA